MCVHIIHLVFVFVAFEFDEDFLAFDVDNLFVLHDAVFLSLGPEVALNVLLIFNPLNEVCISLLKLDLVDFHFTWRLNCE